MHSTFLKVMTDTVQDIRSGLPLRRSQWQTEPQSRTLAAAD